MKSTLRLRIAGMFLEKAGSPGIHLEKVTIKGGHKDFPDPVEVVFARCAVEEHPLFGGSYLPTGLGGIHFHGRREGKLGFPRRDGTRAVM